MLEDPPTVAGSRVVGFDWPPDDAGVSELPKSIGGSLVSEGGGVFVPPEDGDEPLPEVVEPGVVPCHPGTVFVGVTAPGEFPPITASNALASAESAGVC